MRDRDNTGNRVEVSGSQIGNDLVGRDKNVLNVNLYDSSEKVFAYIQSLSLKFKKEQEQDEKIDSLIEGLIYYTNSDGVVLGLDKKLEDTEFEINLKYARSAKERFSKKLFKFEYFQSAQEIFVFLLAKIESNFAMFIYPKLIESTKREEVLDLIEKHIIKPIYDELGDNVLGLNQVDIYGMMYFLTGNCHLDWK